MAKISAADLLAGTGVAAGGALGLSGAIAGKNQQAQSQDPIQQMLDLELQAIDAESMGDGGGGRVSYSAGPAVASLTQFGKTGDSKLAELYAGLNDYLGKGAQETKQIYDQGTQNVTGYYDQGAKDIQQAQQSAQGQIANSAALSPAGQGAAGDAQNAANAAIQRQQAIESTAKSNQLATIAQLGAGHQAIANEIMQGATQEGTAQRAKLQTQVANMIGQAQAKAAQANASSSSSSSSSAGKTQAAKLRAMEAAVGRQSTADQKTSGQTPKGIQGVIDYATKLGHPELASKFMQMVSASRVNAANANSQSMSNPAIGKNTTSAEDELQKLIGNSGTVNPSIAGLSNQRGPIDNTDLADLIQTDPKFSFLKKYLAINPKSIALGKLGGPQWLKQGAIDKDPTLTHAFVINSFSDSDYKQFQKILQDQANQQDTLGILYDIYNGKY